MATSSAEQTALSTKVFVNQLEAIVDSPGRNRLHHPFVEAVAAGTASTDQIAGWLHQFMLWADPANKFLRSFGITPTKHNFSGDQSLSVMAMLYPMSELDAKGNKAGLMTKLSFSAPAVAPEKGKGEEWLVLSESVTYLLYPFVTCGATDGWDTGISVSNTSADGNIFGAFDETKQQDGSVVMYGFPTKRTLSAVAGEDGERMVEPIVDTISTVLLAGETITFQCSDTEMATKEGYAIIRAGFQHARGMAFVVGDFPDGAGADVAHGYVAEVITDPSTRSDELK